MLGISILPNKQITTAEGGMIVTDDPQIANLCRSLRNQGRDADAGWLRHANLGYNYRLSELHSALGLAQLERIDDLLAARQLVAALYSRLLADIPQIALPRIRRYETQLVRLCNPTARVVGSFFARSLDGELT